MILLRTLKVFGFHALRCGLAHLLGSSTARSIVHAAHGMCILIPWSHSFIHAFFTRIFHREIVPNLTTKHKENIQC